MNLRSNLYIVPTPIGHLEDFTYRAVKVLKAVDLILAEDTRTSSVLLRHYEISTPTESFHAHNEHKKAQKMIAMLKEGKRVAQITDAGTPGISDPGYLLIREALKFEIEVEVLPGATAFVPALIKSGFPCNQFVFEGFLPHKKGRMRQLNALQKEIRTIILYESSHRLLKTLQQLCVLFGKQRKISVSRELTKKFEETINGEIEEVFAYFSMRSTIKGEFVIVIESAKIKKRVE